ncbi:MAG: nitroreductase family protein [Chloroflexota bacterium]
MTTAKFVPHTQYKEYPVEEMEARSAEFLEEIRRRRTVREFSDRPVPRKIIENCLLAAGTAPSGANLQPWQFAIISDPEIKAKIREAAEEEERSFYESRAPQEWLDALEPLGTDANKEFLTIAPYLIAIFAKSYDVLPNEKRVRNYYVNESVGLATGTLITALHHAGLASLTHTPNPMRFLNEVLGRPENERPIILLVVGYPAEDAQVPVHAMEKKALDEIAVFF